MMTERISKTLTGFSLLELLITLAIVAIVSAFMVPYFGSFLQRTQTELVSSRLLQAIKVTRNQAIVSGSKTTLAEAALHNNAKGILYWRSFPAHQPLEFTPAGLTNTENGTFWYCLKTDKLPAWAIIINQAGRARLVYPDKNHLIIDSKGLPLGCT